MNKKSKLQLKTIVIILLLVLVLVLLVLKSSKSNTLVKNNTPSQDIEQVKTVPVSITTKNIKEDNFSGTESVVLGTAPIAVESRAYIDKTVLDFKTQADKDVPAMIAKFGAGSPPATYTIDIESKFIKGIKTDSIVTSVYEYTGGANGNSYYKVITGSATSGKILLLSDIIKNDQQTAFTDYLKKQLDTWAPEGTTAPVVFPDTVKDLTFSSFTN